MRNSKNNIKKPAGRKKGLAPAEGPNVDSIRHSISHIVALATMEKFPKAKLGIGPTIENGFYYDFGLKEITDENLKSIEGRSRELLKQGLKFKKEIVTPAEAKKIFKDQPFKLELIDELKKQKKTISIYKTYDKSPKDPLFIDLCAGPHVKSTSEIDPEAFKLTSIAGAYWKGDEKNPMLQRIYGLAFASKKALNDYLVVQAEAEKRDHRKLGAELELFMISDEVGQGLPLFLPKGSRLRHEIMTFALNTYLKNGYEMVTTPHIGSQKLWDRSGHTGFYKDSMYAPFGIEGENYLLKPMNCPLHIQLYKSKPRSYRDLPIRWTEMGTVYRYERSGTLHGLTRVRGFTQDDAHIFCTPEQIEDEVKKALKLTIYILGTFGFRDLEMNLSVRDPKKKGDFIGGDKDWAMAEKALRLAMEEMRFKDFAYDVGGAAFYGPKIDIKVSDAIGRKWQLSTIQFDFNEPARFDMAYTDDKGKEKRPLMVHRALLGSLERFMGVYIEHVAGAFPVWIAPVQAAIIPISEKFNRYAKDLEEKLMAEDIRTELYSSAETLGRRIRAAEMQKIPYILIVGEAEMKSNTVSVRKRGEGDLGAKPVDAFLQNLKQEIKNRK
ncbi:MAG: threonine--tRNA ligase [Patescibacteria group bacterium]|nr:threonine--tRNA ligase [Patescibacteria group bacterium]MCL5261971.1 threonine--tRNA ligase [Patescibacteria group bacterium]